MQKAHYAFDHLAGAQVRVGIRIKYDGCVSCTRINNDFERLVHIAA